MSVGYLRQAPPASVADIARLEQHIGRQLPAPYRDYLLHQDGGRLDDNDRAAKVVFGLGDDAPKGASMWRKLAAFDGRVPSWLLPIAQDEYGNLFAISLRTKDEGSIWFWDHEEEAGEEDEAPTEDNIERIADDWRQFLQQLEPV